MPSGKRISKYSYWQNLSVTTNRTDRALYAKLATHKAFGLIRITSIYNTLYLDHMRRFPSDTVSQARFSAYCDLKCILDEVHELTSHLKFKL